MRSRLNVVQIQYSIGVGTILMVCVVSAFSPSTSSACAFRPFRGALKPRTSLRAVWFKCKYVASGFRSPCCCPMILVETFLTIPGPWDVVGSPFPRSPPGLG